MLRRFAFAATRLAWGGFVVWLGTVAPLCAQQALNRWDYHKGETTLELTGVFDPPPPSGYQPIRASVRNAAAAKRSWEIDVRFSGGYGSGAERRGSRFAVEVEPNQEKTVVLLAPVASPLGTSRSYSSGVSLDVNVRSPQLGAENFTAYDEVVVGFPAVAISDELAKKSLTQLSDEVKKQTSRTYTTSVFGSRYVPAHLPEDWLGFSGFDYVMITADEWLALAPGLRAALLQWVNFGGRLHVYAREGATSFSTLGIAGIAEAPPEDAASEEAPEPAEEAKTSLLDEEVKLPPLQTAATPAPAGSAIAGHLMRGLGSIEIRSWNGDTLEAEATVKSYLGKNERLVWRLAEDYGSGQKWGLETALGERNFAGWQVVVFLILFGILVGPVNLFVLAPSGKRHRLFFTTPVISVAASVIVIGLIFFQDGTGGQGRRLAAIFLAPGEAAAYVTQEQISRTGVLFSSGFTLPQPAQYEALRLKDSQWVKLGSAGGRGLESRQEGLAVSGNWFQSRAVQGQFLRARVPTRGRIEWLPAVTPEGAPSIISSLDFTLETFACLDAQGREWLAPGPVVQGQKITLIPRSGAFRETRTAGLAAASSTLSQQITRAVSAPSVFFATASAAPGYTLDTLKSIDWRDDQIVVFGPLPVPR